MKSVVADFIEKNQLLSADGLYIVALSGGADSVALLRILYSLGYHVEAAHCNFNLRGQESDRDECFVKELCKKLEIPLHLIHFDTREYASIHQVSIEMAARELRYGYFNQLCQDIGADSVCVAHHRDDAIETFIMNLLRGSGIHGLTGIRPQNGKVVRPFLCVSRHDIENYLHSIGQDYVTDSTNLETDIVRNKIRLNIIPLLETINPSAVENIGKTANYLRDVEKIYDSFMQSEIARLVIVDSNTNSQVVSIPDLLLQPSIETFLHEWLSPYNFNASQISQMTSLLVGVPGKLFMSSSHVLLIDRDKLILETQGEPVKSMRIPEAGRYRFDANLMFEFVDSSDITILKSNDYICIDSENIQYPLTIRPIQKGDRFIPFGMEGHKLVSDFLTDRKLNLLEKRRQLVVVNSNGDILWLVGQRTDHRYRIKSSTKRVLKIRLIR